MLSENGNGNERSRNLDMPNVRAATLSILIYPRRRRLRAIENDYPPLALFREYRGLTLKISGSLQSKGIIPSEN